MTIQFTSSGIGKEYNIEIEAFGRGQHLGRITDDTSPGKMSVVIQQPFHLTADALRQIADKIDELNGRREVR